MVTAQLSLMCEGNALCDALFLRDSLQVIKYLSLFHNYPVFPYVNQDPFIDSESFNR